MAGAETKIQSAIVDKGSKHEAVAWLMVVTTGLVKKAGFKMTVGKHVIDGERFDGTSDIIGQLIDGRMVAIEVKVPGQTPNKNQTKFLSLVIRHGGVGFWADSWQDAIKRLDALLSDMDNSDQVSELVQQGFDLPPIKNS